MQKWARMFMKTGKDLNEGILQTCKSVTFQLFSSSSRHIEKPLTNTFQQITNKDACGNWQGFVDPSTQI